MTDEPLAWTQAEVAAALRVTPRTVRELTKSGQLRATYVGRLPRYLPADVKAYLASRRQRVA
jgi:excisionase family DNA binding protein